MSIDFEDTNLEGNKGWGKFRWQLERRKMQAMREKRMGRYPYRGTCTFCEKVQEQLIATVIDLCTHCTAACLQKENVFFRLMRGRINYRGHRCQRCNSKTIRMNQANVRACTACLGKAARRA